jgi:hypothetical protein
MMTLNTFGHMWPDADESARAAVGVVLAARADSLAKILADYLRTSGGLGNASLQVRGPRASDVVVHLELSPHD